MIRDLYVTHMAIFNRHGISLKQIAKCMDIACMDIAFLALIDQLLEDALEMIDMNNRPLFSATCLERGRSYYKV